MFALLAIINYSDMSRVQLLQEVVQLNHHENLIKKAATVVSVGGILNNYNKNLAFDAMRKTLEKGRAAPPLEEAAPLTCRHI